MNKKWVHTASEGQRWALYGIVHIMTTDAHPPWHLWKAIDGGIGYQLYRWDLRAMAGLILDQTERQQG